MKMHVAIGIMAIIAIVAIVVVISTNEEPDDGSPVGTLTYDCYYFTFSDYIQINYQVKAEKKFEFDPTKLKWIRSDG